MAFGVPLFLLAVLASPAASQVVVEAVDPGSAAAKAGLVAGDFLSGWRRQAAAPGNPRAASGRFASWLDVEAALVDEAPRPPFFLEVVREGKTLHVLLPQGDHGLDARPGMSREVLEAARIARRKLSLAKTYRREDVPDVGDAPAACWLAARVAGDFGARRLPEAARAAFADARACTERLGGKSALARLLAAEGTALRGAEDLAAAAAVLREAVSLAEAAQPRSLLAAHAWHQLGLAERTRGELEAARAAFEKARAIREASAPASLALGYTYNNLGIVDLLKTDLKPAEAWCRKALAQMRRADPGGPGEGDVLNNLSLIARDHGDYPSAERDLARATEIRKALGPESPSYGYSLVNLAALASDRGDPARSDGLLEEALALFEKMVPGGLTSAHILNNLSVSARDRGDYATAEDLLRRALAIREKVAPESLEVASTLSNLGGVLELSGRLEEAIETNERALAIRQKRAPGGIEASWSLEAIGHVARSQGDLVKARDYFQKAAALREKSGQGRAYAGALENLGETLRDLGELDQAEAVLQKTLGLMERLAPGSLAEAQTSHALGVLLAKRGDLAGARRFFERTLDALDAQLGRIGGTDEGRTGFASERDAAFKDEIDLLERTGHGAEAFGCRERDRARSLLAMLAGRGVDLVSELPPSLRALARRLDREIGKLEESLAVEASAASQEKLLGRLRALREERGRLEARAARSSRRLAALEAPRPMTAAQERAALAPGDLLLAYTVLPSRTLLFVVPAASDPQPFSVRSVPVGAEALASEVSVFRSLILAGREKPGPAPALEAQARRLWDLLVGPAGPAVARARRLVLSPDGPLDILPFAALRTPSGRWLAEELPTHRALSATLEAELARSPRVAGGGSVVFGAPDVREAADAPGPPLMRYRRGLPPLPAAREEAEGVAAIFGGAARLFTGADATEERARTAGADARIVHFAGHALLDRKHPLESGLAMAHPRPAAGGAEDGLLQAWEVVRSVRLHADLVTLSGCETALGAEVGGEGLLGLTRAFQFAGARSVLASLWSVSDRSTTLLMTSFYRRVRAGRPRDEALQDAQRELLRGPFAHPYHWSSFVLSGNPR